MRATDPDRKFAIALARAFGGAIIFALPLLMTMEMWTLGAVMPPGRLLVLVVLWVPLLVGLSAVAGFEQTVRVTQDVVDALVAIAVGVVASTLILVLLGVLDTSVSGREALGMILLQALPASMGALLASSQLGAKEEEGGSREERRDTWGGEIFLMAVGALFLAFNIAPTEEITLLGLRMSPWHSLVAVVASLAMMHAFVYSLEFAGQAGIRPGTPFASVFLRYTVAGYGLVLLLCAFTLWCFGRFDGMSAPESLSLIVALGIPGAIGGAAARLIL